MTDRVDSGGIGTAAREALARSDLTEHQVWALGSALVLVGWFATIVAGARTPEHRAGLGDGDRGDQGGVAPEMARGDRVCAAGGGDHRDAFSSRAILGRVTDPLAPDETRVDRWLCAVRLAKTRPLGTRLCEAGHVLVNGSPAKPSTKVRAGDRVEALIADRRRIVEVLRPIESRVGAAVAATCYVDHSPPVVLEAEPAIMRVRGEGRPSKRRRREFERLRRGADA